MVREVGNLLETERRRRARRRGSRAPAELIMEGKEAQREGVVVRCLTAAEGLLL